MATEGYQSINGDPEDATEGDIKYCRKKIKEYCWKKTKELYHANGNTSLSRYTIKLINIQNIQSTVLKYLRDYTIGSCSCCCGKSRDHYHDSLGSVDDLKKILRFHFMSPFQKWSFKERRKFPWKLVVQIISIIFVTTQVLSISCVTGNMPKQNLPYYPFPPLFSPCMYTCNYSLSTLLEQSFMSLTS